MREAPPRRPPGADEDRARELAASASGAGGRLGPSDPQEWPRRHPGRMCSCPRGGERQGAARAAGRPRRRLAAAAGEQRGANATGARESSSCRRPTGPQPRRVLLGLSATGSTRRSSAALRPGRGLLVSVAQLQQQQQQSLDRMRQRTGGVIPGAGGGGTAARSAAEDGDRAMLIIEILWVALDAILANKLRSLLTMLGIVIGIAAVITMVALGEGAQRRWQARLQTLGANVLTVRPGPVLRGGLGRGPGDALGGRTRRRSGRSPQYIPAVAPEMESRAAGRVRQRATPTCPSSALAQLLQHQQLPVAPGRLLHGSERTAAGAASPCWARWWAGSSGLASTRLVGQTIRIGGVPFEVDRRARGEGRAGVLEPGREHLRPAGHRAVPRHGQRSACAPSPCRPRARTGWMTPWWRSTRSSGASTGCARARRRTSTSAIRRRC